MPYRPLSAVIQQRDFLVCTPERDVRAVARHMKQYHQGAILVVAYDGGPLVGVCTERDLAFKVISEGLDPNTTPVRNVMTANPVTLTLDKPFGHALHLMYEGGFRHMPVIDEAGRPVGLVSSRDALGLEIFNFASDIESRQHIAEVL